MMKHWH